MSGTAIFWMIFRLILQDQRSRSCKILPSDCSTWAALNETKSATPPHTGELDLTTAKRHRSEV
jgi:hypothetical protein